MPLFSFSVVNKPKPRSVSKPSIEEHKCLVRIDDEGSYYVIIKDNKVFIRESYDLTNIKVVYCKISKGKERRVCIVRNEDYVPNLDNTYYSPFGVGCLISCHLSNGKAVFDKLLKHKTEYSLPIINEYLEKRDIINANLRHKKKSIY